jgi:hypothetical protein
LGLISDLDPTGNICSSGATVQMGGQNIGDLLNAKNIIWGGFMGGFDLTIVNPNGTTGCNRSSPAAPSNSSHYTNDYIPPRAWFNIIHRPQIRTICGQPLSRKLAITAQPITNMTFTTSLTR